MGTSYKRFVCYKIVPNNVCVCVCVCVCVHTCVPISSIYIADDGVGVGG